MARPAALSYQEDFRRAAAGAGLPPEFIPHSLRHLYASTALAEGIPITEMSRPPHLLARDAYDSIAPTDVICTGEYPDADAPHPVVFGLVEGAGLQLLDVDDTSEERPASAGSGAKILKRLALTAVVAGALRWPPVSFSGRFSYVHSP